MRLYPGTPIDYEFAALRALGYSGSLNDMQFAALRAEGLTGSLADMMKQFDGSLVGDVTAPTINSTSPADNATGVLATVSPTITFSENIAFGTGLITLRENNGGWADLETFDVVTEVGVGNGQVSISGAVLTINPTASLTASREYAIRIAATAIDDIAGNSFAGVANDTTISFTVAAASSAVNTSVPTIDAIAYPGGAYTINQGGWDNETSLELRLESSVNGVSGWTDQGVISSTGVWSNSLENLYVRAKVTAQPGSVIAYSAAFQLGQIFDQMVDFAGTGNYISHTVSAPFLGMSTGNGVDFWLMAQWYFDGGGGDGALVALGDASAGSTNATMGQYNTIWRDGGANSASIISSFGGAGSTIHTARFRNVGGDHISQMWANGVTGPESTASGTISLTPFTTLRIGDEVSNAPAFNHGLPIAWVAWGRGNPAAAHAAIYNSGEQIRADAYNWAGDPNGATMDGFALMSRKSPGNTTFAPGQITDSVGAYDSWSQTGSMAWTGRIPGFVNPAGDPPATPAAFISPEFASTTDSTLTLNINTKNIGAALGGDLTISSLTHSVAGNIAGTVSGSSFPNPGAGTITGTVNGVAVSCEITAPLNMPTNPQFWTRYSENALVAAIEEYPTYGAGTTYANIAALKAGIDALGAGATLTVENLTQAGTLTLTAKDYGGATVRCRFRHGVAINNIVMDGVENLTLIGFSCLSGGFDGSGVGGNITLEHCTGTNWFLTGTTGADENLTVRNWIGPDDGTAETSGCSLINRYTVHRVAHGNTAASTDDCHKILQVNILDQDRCFFGDVKGTSPGGHYDCQQSYGSGSTGVTKGRIIQSVFLDRNKAGETALSGGLFMTGINARGLRIKNVVDRTESYQGIVVGPANQNVRVEATTSYAPSFVTNTSLAYSSLADNNLRQAAGNVLPTGITGPETGTTNSVVFTTAYPDFTTYPDSWRGLRNPAVGYTDKGAYALIAELEAKRLTL